MNKKQKLDDLLSQASILYNEIIEEGAVSKKGYEGKYFLIGGSSIFRCDEVVHATDKEIQMVGVIVNANKGGIRTGHEFIYRYNVTPMYELNRDKGEMDFNNALDVALNKIKNKL